LSAVFCSADTGKSVTGSLGAWFDADKHVNQPCWCVLLAHTWHLLFSSSANVAPRHRSAAARATTQPKSNVLLLHNYITRLRHTLDWVESFSEGRWTAVPVGSCRFSQSINFLIQLIPVGDVLLCRGVAPSKKAARQIAAGATLQYLRMCPHLLPARQI